MSKIILTDGTRLDPMQRNMAFSMSRVPGYGGYRRKASIDHSRSHSSRVPSNVVKAITSSQDVRSMFLRIDADKNGVLSESELTKELKRIDVELSDRECQQVFRSVDVEGSGRITMERWVQWIVELEGLLPPDGEGRDQWQKVNTGSHIPGYGGTRRKASEDRGIGASKYGKVNTRLMDKLRAGQTSIEEAFRAFDTDGSNTLSDSELREGLKVHGIKLSPGEFVAMFNEIDINGDGELQWDEFSAWLEPKGQWRTTAMDSGTFKLAAPAAEIDNDGAVMRNRPKQMATVSPIQYTAAERAAPRLPQICAPDPAAEIHAGEEWMSRGGGRKSTAPMWVTLTEESKRMQQNWPGRS